jgi:ABC-type proline/glycine betaine transport system permease subunit
METIIIGISLMVMSLCLVLVAESSGLSGRLMYLALHPGITAPGFFGGLALVIAAMVMKPVPRELM